jgi:hypothetical protein
MMDEVPDHRLVELEKALDEVLEAETRPHFYHTKLGKRRVRVKAPNLHTTRVMRAFYSEAALRGDLSAPLAGALSFYQLKELTNLKDDDLDRALNILVGDRLRTRFDSVANYRIYFLPALQRSLLRKALSSLPSPIPCRLPRLVA